MAPATVHPAKIGRYQIQEEVGRGMMGIVYRALDPDLGREVALKTVRLAFAVSEQEREAFGRRFLAEARAVAAVSHPGIVLVHDAGSDTETAVLYIAFEYLRGRNLARLTADGFPLDWRDALRLTARVARALDHAHSNAIIHRDIKPSNIMVLDSGEPKIMDFGIAKVPAERLTATGQHFGTPSYMSPEQISGETLDGRSDLFSLGAVLYLLLTGHAAFERDSVPATFGRILYHDPPPPSGVTPSLSATVDSVLGRALAKRRADRYPDGIAFAEDLEDVLAGLEPRHLRCEEAQPAAAAEPLPRAASVARGLEAGNGAFLVRQANRIGRRGLLSLGGLAAVVVLATRFMPSGLERVLPVTAIVPAQLEIDFEHSLRSGTLRIWLDDELVLEEGLESYVKEDLLVLKLRRGRERKTLEVRPGDHEVRLQVTGDGFSGSRSIRGQFESGATRRLDASLGGLLRKELTVAWGS